MFKNLFRSHPGGDKATTAADLVPHRAEVEFVLVLVDAVGDQQLTHTIGAVTASVAGYGGTILQILGPLIFVGFSGIVGCAPKTQRQAFVDHVCSCHRLFVKAVHGRASALVGLIGCDTRVAYTAIPDHFGSIVQRLSGLSRGEAAEYGVEPKLAEQPPGGS